MARKTRKTAKTTEQRRAELAALRDRLAEFETEQDEASIALITSLHDGYSDRNAMLIAMQMPEATDVSGFKTWQGRGRSVKPGEHGIQILAPAGTVQVQERGDYGAKPEERDVKDDEGKTRQLFKLAYVFDVSQTEPLEIAQARWAAKAAERAAAADAELIAV